GSGSIGITAQARAAFIVAADPVYPGARVLAPAKQNLAVMPPSLADRVEAVERPGPGNIPHVVWGGKSQLTAAGLFGSAEDAPPPHQRDRACEFLADALADGPRLKADLEAEAEDDQISMSTLRRAKKKLGVRAFKESGGAGRWWWRLPEPEQP